MKNIIQIKNYVGNMWTIGTRGTKIAHKQKYGE